ncbi:UDP-N-acetylmuramate dehydrogenase [Roseisolibacter agri]|uniref:UDP-N-acetylenolpyruvoylglucosamine reductase n=1 Tax=Roseisolibacter agri TaxID=2014610 RepID=A0AA37Q660_9BACT|nr:UDP-N-acetylmuramate dehydrogenase [Roseisolibacter agri]GLC24452.1 UDP-N-acetylenolpyruvoylglucosamine reductase [Roseisolibacter agri]
MTSTLPAVSDAATGAAPTTATPLTDDQLDALRGRLGADRVRRGVRLAQYTSFRIGGPADALYTARSADELEAAIRAARELGIPHFLLGLGANILVGDRGFRGLVIRNAARHFRIRPEGDTGHLWAESGAIMQDIILEAVERGWSGIEHYIGIPSTVGGAIWQNLHFLSPAPERERTMFIAEAFESCEILSEEGERKVVDADYVQFGYDDTVFHHRRDIVLSATFRLQKGDPDRLHRILHENLSWRGARHPWLQIHPSAGSIFKKIEGVGAGRLVDQAGLKGHRHGGAQISPMHANIVVNRGSATAKDVRELIALAQRAVEEKFGQRLEPEIGFIGEF